MVAGRRSGVFDGVYFIANKCLTRLASREGSAIGALGRSCAGTKQIVVGNVLKGPEADSAHVPTRQEKTLGSFLPKVS
jgi:hypothetical protein